MRHQTNSTRDCSSDVCSSDLGTLSASSSITDANGITGIKFTLDQVKGSKSVVAHVVELNQDFTFNLKGKAGAAAHNASHAGGNKTDTVSVTPGDNLQALVTDQYSNTADSVRVLWHITSPNGGHFETGFPSAA